MFWSTDVDIFIASGITGRRMTSGLPKGLVDSK